MRSSRIYIYLTKCEQEQFYFIFSSLFQADKNDYKFFDIFLSKNIAIILNNINCYLKTLKKILVFSNNYIII